MPGKHSYCVLQLCQLHTVGIPLTVGQVLRLNDLHVLSHPRVHNNLIGWGQLIQIPILQIKKFLELGSKSKSVPPQNARS